MYSGNQEETLREQVRYYQARAEEYDEWFLRQGRYDRGQELNQRWFSEVRILYQELDTFSPRGSILELACGTGIWTQQLLRYADRITAVDAVPEVIAINQRRTQSDAVSFVQADLFDWQPVEKYDVVFFSFWLSHVPPELFKPFWDMVAQALKPGGRVFFIDSRFEPTSTARDHQLVDKQSTTTSRRLNDGREFQIVKVFYERSDILLRLRKMGWKCSVKETENYFLYGYGRKSSSILQD